MEILEYFGSENQDYWLEQIGASDWGAGQYLYGLIKDNRIKELCGKKTKVLLLVKGKELLSFCTYAEQDDIRDFSLTPWAGFVYTFPHHRGRRLIGKLLEHVYALAKADGHEHIYISTGEIGLYEKYGYAFWKVMKNINGGDSRVYRMDIVPQDYRNVLGTVVSGSIDRPLGSSHPRHPEMVYPINYGFVDGISAGDGGEQDAYVFGSNKPLEQFTGKVIGVYHRLNDCEDKWIVSLDDREISKNEILKKIEFQEQYFMGELYML